MDNVKKILIVGEKLTGKSSIIQVFKEYDANGASSITDSTENTNRAARRMSQVTLAGQHTEGLKDTADARGSKTTGRRLEVKQPNFNVLSQGLNADFSLKILRIDGRKVRVQLWDQGSNMNPQTTFQPLFVRHVSGCIIVANTSNPKSIERAYKWKMMFDKMTKIPDEPSVPATLFINHDLKHGIPKEPSIKESQFKKQEPEGTTASEHSQQVDTGIRQEEAGPEQAEDKDENVVSADRVVEDEFGQLKPIESSPTRPVAYTETTPLREGG